MAYVNDLRDMEELLTTGDVNAKKKRLHRRFITDLERMVSKYEYMYNKYIIGNRKLKAIASEKERDIAIVQRSMTAFFPYMIAYNLAQMSEGMSEGMSANYPCD